MDNKCKLLNNYSELDIKSIIAHALNVPDSEIKDISVLKKGMTNRSFSFSYDMKKYILRVPGEGTEKLINRSCEAEVYKIIDGKQICDEVVYINPENGCKISSFIEKASVCNPNNEDDLRKCMEKLRSFHEMRLSVNHEFDIFGQIEFYESLWGKKESVYEDYKKTKECVGSLKEYIDAHVEYKCLSHIDSVPDNFLLTAEGEVVLIDWEYAGMQDPHVDIAMFCIYALYNRREVDRLIDIYFAGECKNVIRIKIYCYISACGLLWSNWCEYKRSLGVEFGEYSQRQYQYAKDYYRIVTEELEKYVSEGLTKNDDDIPVSIYDNKLIINITNLNQQ